MGNKPISVEDDLESDVETDVSIAAKDAAAEAISELPGVETEVDLDAKSIIPALEPTAVAAGESVALDLVSGQTAAAKRAAALAAKKAALIAEPILASDASKITLELKPRLFAVYNVVAHDFINDARTFTVELPKNVANEFHAIEQKLKEIVSNAIGKKVVGLSHTEISGATHIPLTK